LRNQKTVLVLGAGASKGFGLPLGTDLRDQIAKDLNIKFDDFGLRLASGSPEIVAALRVLTLGSNGQSGDINPHRAAAVQIASSMNISASIDDYIERHQGNVLLVECAKLAIGKAILGSELRSKLFSNHLQETSDPFRHFAGSWLALLLRDLTRGKTTANLDTIFENISIVNFNYDRCVEQFTFLWFQRMYDLTPSEASEVANRLKIHHPYGMLAPLPHQNQSDHIAFGGELGAHQLVKIAASIKTYSESIDEGTEIEKVRMNLVKADRLVFLGFGFHQQNLDLLTVPVGSERATLRCYATTEGISLPHWEMIQSSISQALRVTAPNGFFCGAQKGTCEEFWNEYGAVVVQ
jgi:hypothetical protein